jgi:hypothetical protein
MARRPAGDADEIADALADLASALSIRMREAAGLADNPPDRTACQDAAREAERITWLLARDST